MRKHLTNRCKYDKLTTAPDAVTHREIFGGVAQLGERTVRIRKVRSSILPVSTKKAHTAFAVCAFFFWLPMLS